MKRFLIFALCLIECCLTFAQSYNSKNATLGNYLKRMYLSAPFDGVRIFEDYDNVYLLSVVTLDIGKYPSESAQDRVAGVKAMSQASRYFNGSSVSSEIIIHTEEHSDGSNDSDIIENIREKSSGYVRELELIVSFIAADNQKVYFYGKRLDISSPQDKKK